MTWWIDVVRYHFCYLSLHIWHKIGITHKNVNIHEFEYRSFFLLQTAITIIFVEISICFFLEKKEMHESMELKQQYWMAKPIWLGDGALKHPTPHVNRYDRTWSKLKNFFLMTSIWLIIYQGYAEGSLEHFGAN